MIRVVLPFHLRSLANVGREVELNLEGEATFAAVLDQLELQYPMLHGAIRDYVSGERRPYIRFFACGLDFSLDPLSSPLPQAVRDGKEPLRIVGAMSGG
jgi:hypothetical protein